MANILNIDTTSRTCSVSLAQNGETVMGLESKDEMDHSRVLAPFVNQCMEYTRKEGLRLDAVSVISGPGSYTGLRIGLSLAKGMAFGLDIPLITLSSLEVMAVGVMFSYRDWEGDETIVPMIDARRMEVFTAVYDSSLKIIAAPQPMILTPESFQSLQDCKKIIFAGDGAKKFEELYAGKNSVWMPHIMPHAKFMGILSEKFYRENKFADIAYSAPEYLKEYQTTVSKKKFNNNNDKV